MFSGKAPDGKPYKVGCIFAADQPHGVHGGLAGRARRDELAADQLQPADELHLRLLGEHAERPEGGRRTRQLKYVGGEGFTGVLFGLGKAKGISSFTGNFTALDARTNKIAWRKNWPADVR